MTGTTLYSMVTGFDVLIGSKSGKNGDKSGMNVELANVCMEFWDATILSSGMVRGG